jgi:GTPase SAR1 family protein
LRCSIGIRSWDFAGQQIYAATHQFFITKNTVYVVAFNMVSGMDQIENKVQPHESIRM